MENIVTINELAEKLNRSEKVLKEYIVLEKQPKDNLEKQKELESLSQEIEELETQLSLLKGKKEALENLKF